MSTHAHVYWYALTLAQDLVSVPVIAACTTAALMRANAHTHTYVIHEQHALALAQDLAFVHIIEPRVAAMRTHILKHLAPAMEAALRASMASDTSRSNSAGGDQSHMAALHCAHAYAELGETAPVEVGAHAATSACLLSRDWASCGCRPMPRGACAAPHAAAGKRPRPLPEDGHHHHRVCRLIMAPPVVSALQAAVRAVVVAPLVAQHLAAHKAAEPVRGGLPAALKSACRSLARAHAHTSCARA